ncbi:MAG: hypothetical protein ABI981_00755 [Betaproteobacteria bacterium]
MATRKKKTRSKKAPIDKARRAKAVARRKLVADAVKRIKEAQKALKTLDTALGKLLVGPPGGSQDVLGGG